MFSRMRVARSQWLWRKASCSQRQLCSHKSADCMACVHSGRQAPLLTTTCFALPTGCYTKEYFTGSTMERGNSFVNKNIRIQNSFATQLDIISENIGKHFLFNLTPHLTRVRSRNVAPRILFTFVAISIMVFTNLQ